VDDPHAADDDVERRQSTWRARGTRRGWSSWAWRWRAAERRGAARWRTSGRAAGRRCRARSTSGGAARWCGGRSRARRPRPRRRCTGDARNASLRLQGRERRQAAASHHARHERPDGRRVDYQELQDQSELQGKYLQQMKRFLAVLFLLVALPVYAQNANQTQLRLVVVDETGAGIPNATIIVTPANGNAVTFTSDERGLASSPNLPAGNAKLHVEFAGFQPFEEPINLRRGAMNQTVTLKIAGLQEEVVVNDTTALDDRRGNSQSTTLEESEIEELPEDPEELADVLAAMAGGSGAVFQVNGFRGGRLPSRDEIRQIRFRTNSFSADNHDAGRTQIEIITRPNVRTWNGNGSFNYRGDAMNARNAFATEKTPEQNRNFNLGARGPIIKGKTSIRLGLDGRRDYQADTIVAVDENGNRLGDYVRGTCESTNATIGLEHALNNNQTLRLEYRRGENTVENNGVGGFNLPERAFNTHSENNQFRMQAQGIVGKSMLHEVRLQFYTQQNIQTSLSQAPTIVVLDTFTKGGAGVSSRGSNRTFELAENLDFNIGRKQQMRVGYIVEGGRYKNFDARNAAGTYTYSTLEAFNENRPITFTQRLGQVDTSFTQYNVGFYWSDDVRLNNKFSFGVGVRNELQTHISGGLNLM